MAKIKQLQDVYRFPGFVPQPDVRGVFGDPRAVVITLQRCQKKLPAAFAGMRMIPTTTNVHGASATSPVGTSAFISFSWYAGSSAPGVLA
jgi:hypothetical protein